MSTSFKQSALTIAVLFTIPALSHAAEEFVITEGTQYETNKYAGIYQPTEDFNSDVVVTTGTLPEGHTRIFGMQLDNHEITFHGSVSVDANATTPGAMAYGIRVDKAANVTIMGDRTGGGSGFPFTSELPNGWTVRFSACPMLDENKQLTEFGIDPDIPVAITDEDLWNGIDTIVEKAIELLKQMEGDETKNTESTTVTD